MFESFSVLYKLPCRKSFLERRGPGNRHFNLCSTLFNHAYNFMQFVYRLKKIVPPSYILEVFLLKCSANISVKTNLKEASHTEIINLTTIYEDLS